jgi:hypothetical protein
VDGYKFLYEDGVFCEMAVFEPQELAQIPFPQPAIIWHSASFDKQLALPQQPSVRSEHGVDWCIGEILTNLLVGITRFHRGEKLTAQRFIQHYAVDKILNLMPQIEPEITTVYRDVYNAERRFETRFPHTAQIMPNFIQGYDHSIESALAILAFLEQHFTVNQAISAEIKRLAHL